MNVCGRVVTGVTILYLDGRLVTNSRPISSLRTIVCDQVRQGRLVVLIHMAGVTDMDAHGLGVLVSSLTALERRGGRMALVAPTDHVRRLLALTGLDTVFAVFDSEAEAIVRYRPIAVPTASWFDSHVVLDGRVCVEVCSAPHVHVRQEPAPESTQLTVVSSIWPTRAAE